jgi:hypothetical protein
MLKSLNISRRISLDAIVRLAAALLSFAAEILRRLDE